MPRLLILLLVVLFTGCAKRGSITGGAKDTIPPTFTGSIPENYSTKFTGKTIKLQFDEFVKFKDINKQLVVSPPLKNPPIITPMLASKKFTITITDTLQENTTYSLNFGQSLQDNNEGNPLNQFRYVFSTGSYIDSLFIGGKIKDALHRESDNFVSIMLYEVKESYQDSIVYKEAPRYITNTLDSLKIWRIDNVKEGKYRLIALKDKNNNNKYDPKTDKIGFIKDFVTLPTDTLYSLELFKEELAFRPSKPTADKGNKLILPLQGDYKKAKFQLFNGSEELKTAVTKIDKADSIQIWYPAIKADSLKLRIQKNDFEKEYSVRIKAQKSDSLVLKNVHVGNLPLRSHFRIVSATPIEKIENSLIHILKKDSTKVDFTSEYEPWKKEITLKFKPEPAEKYLIDVLPGAFTDFYGNKNDSIQYKIGTRDLTEFGNLTVRLENVNRFPVMVELVDAKGNLLAEKYSEGETALDFNHIDAGKYFLRLFYDDNKNQLWDTGNFLELRQAEEVIYFPKEIEVRANWDYDQPFRLP